MDFTTQLSNEGHSTSPSFAVQEEYGGVLGRLWLPVLIYWATQGMRSSI